MKIENLEPKFRILVLCEISDEFDCDPEEAAEFFGDYIELLKLRIEHNTAQSWEVQIWNRIVQEENK